MLQFKKALQCLVLFCLCFGAGNAWTQTFSDSFAGQNLATGTSLVITGSNTNATIEPGEPLHADKIGGHSVWISWQAPSSGLLTLNTTGSTFDTLLDAWILEPGNDPVFQRLEGVAENDDFGGLKTSLIQFGVNANQTYYIAVDGFNGAAGDISLQLNFLSSSNFQPTVVQRPGDQALRIGDPLILTVGMIPTTSHLDLQWYFNGSPLYSDSSDKPTLVINSLQPTNMGFYSLKLELDDFNFYSSPIEIQANSEGQTYVLARDKLPDAAQSGLGTNNTPLPPGGVQTPGSASGVVVGYNGTQIFNTTNATIDPTEPPICGQTGGATYWFSYVAPTNGIMNIDTSGSAFPTLLGVFTYTGVLYSYTNLISVTCDTNSGADGLSSKVQFTTLKGGNYFIVVDGMNGARGTAHLNYSLSAGLPPQPPVITSQPQMTPAVAANTPVSLGVVASGTAPLAYQWWQNKSKLNRQTNASYLISSPSSQNNGNYFVVVTNVAGAVTSSAASISVISGPLTTINMASHSMISGFPGNRGYQYTADCSTNPTGTAWWPLTIAFPDYGGVIWLTNSMSDSGLKLLRVHTP